MFLDGKVVAVTGGARGIGRVIALSCAREGADIVLASRSLDALEEAKAEIESLGRQALIVPTDIRDEGSVRNLAERSVAHFGRVDALVNNSGITGPTKPLWEITLDEWQETLDINLTGVFLCSRAFLPSMIERGSGSIIFISSMTGKRPLYGRSPYAAAKIALVGLARTLAWEVGPHSIRVNVVSPGPVEGERVERVIRLQAAAEHISEEQARHNFTASSPLARMVKADDIADAVAFLASDRAASITGEDLNVSAGIAMY